jgi:hypothetical protein
LRPRPSVGRAVRQDFRYDVFDLVKSFYPDETKYEAMLMMTFSLGCLSPIGGIGDPICTRDLFFHLCYGVCFVSSARVPLDHRPRTSGDARLMLSAAFWSNAREQRAARLLPSELTSTEVKRDEKYWNGARPPEASLSRAIRLPRRPNVFLPTVRDIDGVCTQISLRS